MSAFSWKQIYNFKISLTTCSTNENYWLAVILLDKCQKLDQGLNFLNDVGIEFLCGDSYTKCVHYVKSEWNEYSSI